MFSSSSSSSSSAKTSASSQPTHPIHNLVFAGGSVKGIAYVGAFDVLAQQRDINQLRRVAGTSAGSIFALLVALGFNTTEMHDILAAFDFKAMLDDSSMQLTPLSNRDKLLGTVEKQEQGKPTAIAKIPAKSGAVPMLWRMHQHLGLFEGEYFRKWVQDLICKRIRSMTQGAHSGEHLTFAELAKLATHYPTLRQLYVVGVNLSLSQAVTFCADDASTADVIIADALRISMSIPYLFEPHSVHRNIGGERKVDTSGHLWVDGGWFRNYPIDVFDAVDTPEHTLGFNLVDEETHNYLSGLSPLPEAKISNMMNFSLALFTSTLHRQQTQLALSQQDRARTVSIPSMGIGTLSFNLTKEQQQSLIDSGKHTTHQFFGVAVSSEINATPSSSSSAPTLTEISNISTTPATTSQPVAQQSDRSITMFSNSPQSSSLFSGSSSSSSSQSSSSSASSPASSHLRQDRYVTVNVWTAEDDPYLPGHNVGHVSIQTPQMYISLWPAARAAEDRVSRGELSKVERLTRDATKHFASRPPNYVQSYTMDSLLEGLSERQVAECRPGYTKPEGYQLVIFNQDSMDIRQTDSDNPAQQQLNPDECLLWVKPVHAGVRLALYSLDVGKIHSEFRALRNSVEGWSMAGSNILQQALGSHTNESCASFGYRILSAGGFQSLLSRVQQGSFSSQASSVVKPGILAQRTVEAKSQEQERHQETAHWQTQDESDLKRLRQHYQPEDKQSQLKLPTFKEEAPSDCAIM